MSSLRCLPLLALTALACSSPTSEPTGDAEVSAQAALPTDLPTGLHIGEEIEIQPIVEFATVDASPSDYFERTVLVEATGVAVCQKAGCWMKIEDEGKSAMVRWETGCGGQYKFPEDAVGKRIVIQGSFYPKEITPEDAEHMREEASDDSLEIPLEGYEFNASGVIVIE